MTGTTGWSSISAQNIWLKIVKRAYGEEVQEDLRLAYVAITRAQLRCYLFWADISGRGANPGSFLSPFGKMLFPGGSCDFQTQYDHLQRLGGADRLLPCADNGDGRHVSSPSPAAAEAVQLQARRIDASSACHQQDPDFIFRTGKFFSP